ncbi:unnamed protein product [Fraxinus pennsylvanica]|uniref:NYN domain-containing protein n=1 Tax=Fraxinus pennsylvanica TaxID=56036 RepID=A0AAD2ADT4_9LAMI|nr:unnamed protein product [Fraxinus pennsylvanica]
MDFSVYRNGSGKRDSERVTLEADANRGASSRESDNEENSMDKKELSLTKEKQTFLEESFKEQSTLNPDLVVILWGIENCPKPRNVRLENVAGNIELALGAHPAINGPVKKLSAYGDFSSSPRRLTEAYHRTGVNLVNVPNGRKDVADKAILVDMFLFALDYRRPATILLILGDIDFAPALHTLRHRGYTIIVAIPSWVKVSSTMRNAGNYLWDWMPKNGQDWPRVDDMVQKISI